MGTGGAPPPAPSLWPSALTLTQPSPLEGEGYAAMTAKLILVGRVAGAFGVKGEVRVSAYTADPKALLSYRQFVDKDGAPVFTLLSGRVQKGDIVGRAKEIATKEEADAMRGLLLHVPRDALPEPEEDEYYLTDLIGMTAVTPAGQILGRIKAVQ